MEPRHVDVLLVGGGVAAARCARTLRRGGFAGTITLVGEEPTPPYNRPPLSKELLRDEVPDELVLAEPVSWYERRGVELRLGVPVTALDPGARVVELGDGTRLHYDSCLLATGAAARAPAFPAHVLRTLADAGALRDAAIAGRRATVVGGGFIGVEVAGSLAARGVAVRLLCGGSLLWGGAFGAATSAWAAAALERAGVDVRFGPVAPDGPGFGATDLVVAGIGVDPRVELATAAGLEVDDGIVVDGSQATSSPGVFAAGDAARQRHLPRVEHWHAAREAGERAGLAMLGPVVPPPRAPWVFSEFADAKLDAVGWPAPDAVEIEAAPGVIGFVRDGALVQVVLLDGRLPVDPVRALIERRAHPSELAQLLVTA
jgi:3-phenylpropionate/trans-cinnamate dioxygenase ferredoxin reductase subunit